jgi:general secretion pathway protein K
MRERGVAVVTALLLTALSVTLVTGIFWQQQVLVRGIEGQRLRLQGKLIARAALDAARLTLLVGAAAGGAAGPI